MYVTHHFPLKVTKQQLVVFFFFFFLGSNKPSFKNNYPQHRSVLSHLLMT